MTETAAIVDESPPGQPAPMDMQAVEAGTERVIRLEPATKARLKEIPRAAPLLYTCFNLGTYVGLSVLAFTVNAAPLWAFVWLMQGIIIVGMWNVTHDCAHGKYARSHRVNRIAGRMFSAPILLNFTIYKHSHLQHHATVGTDEDTEPPYPHMTTFTQYALAIALYGVGMLFGRGSPLISGWRALLLRDFPPFLRTDRIRRQAVVDQLVVVSWIVLVAVALVVAPRLVVMAYLVPLAVYGPFFCIAVLGEHYDTDGGTDILTNAHTTRSNVLLRTLLWNSNFHAEHHAFPTIPSYNLPELHGIIGHHFKYRSTGYAASVGRTAWTLLRRTDAPRR